MPISKKILDEIESRRLKPEEKELLVRILTIEDRGIFRYSEEYEKAVKEFLAAKDGDKQ